MSNKQIDQTRETVSLPDDSKSKAKPMQLRSVKKRESLLAAARIEFGLHGYEQTTAKSIASRAGAATGSFYTYFENKDEVLRELAAFRIETLAKALPKPENSGGQANREALRERFERALNFIYEYHAKEPGLHEVLQQRRGFDDKLNEMLAKGDASLQAQVENFVASFNLPNSNAIAYTLSAMGEGIVHRHVFGNSDLSKEEVIGVGVEMLAAYFESIPPGAGE